MNLLIIGGAGYIAGHLGVDLVKKNYSVTVFDNLSKGFKDNIPKGAEFVLGDILNNEDLEKVFSMKKFDAVFHFAAFKAAGESMIIPQKYAVNNIMGSLNIFNKMIEYNVPKIIFSSSAAVYGEPEYCPIDEKHRLQPENYYGYSKLAIEENLFWYSKIKGIQYGILRYFNAAGYDVQGRVSTVEREVTNLIPVAMETIIGKREYLPVYGNDYNTRDGTCIRDYIHTNDLADAHIKALEYLMDNKDNLLVNLGQSNGVSVMEVIHSVERVTGKKMKFKIEGRRLGDPVTVIASNKLAFQKIGWQPRCSDIDTIVKTTYDVYRKHFIKGEGRTLEN